MDVMSNINNLNIYNADYSNVSQGSGDNSTDVKVYGGFDNKSEISKTNENNNLKDDNKYTNKELDEALKKVNNFLKDEKTHAEYSIHKDFGTVMIKIVDDENDKVIMELPPEKILDMIASMCKQFGLIDKKA